MKYTPENLETDIQGIIDELRDLRKAKGSDYSGATEDTLDNLRDFGFMGIIARLGDKYRRLKTFCLKGVFHCNDETVEDTLKDQINYSLYALIVYRQEKARIPDVGNGDYSNVPCEIKPFTNGEQRK